MKGFFLDNKNKLSMIRLLSLGCYVTGSVVSIGGMIIKMPEAVMSGCALTAVGLGTKVLQKYFENGGG